jgi:hypothetical protein
MKNFSPALIVYMLLHSTSAFLQPGIPDTTFSEDDNKNHGIVYSQTFRPAAGSDAKNIRSM